MPAPQENGKLGVVLVIDDLEYGGAQRQVVELANNLNQERFEVNICSLSPYVPLAVGLESPQRLHVVHKTRRWDAGAVFRLARLLRNLQADVVHGYLFSAEVASRLAGRLAKVPVVIGSQRTGEPSLARRNQLVYRMTKGFTDLIIANSRSGAEAHRRLYAYRREQYRVVYNGVDHERFAPQDPAATRASLSIVPGERVVGVFASFKPKKNHALFFEAARHVLRRIPSTRLLLVGDQLHDRTSHTDLHKRQIRALVEKLGIGERCIFLGNRDDVANLYNACDLTVLPSLIEGAPNVLLESMACGVPVVATDVSDNADIVPNGRVGFVVPLGRPRVMAEKIALLLEDDHLRIRLGTRARRWVRTEFSTSRLAARTGEVYMESLVGRRRKRDRT